MLILLNIGDNIRNKESVTDNYDANVSNDDNYKNNHNGNIDKIRGNTIQ